ncbi:MAG: PEGA domain-containing protein [Defluviitaleaceae bacterium]|nr:PEGA domain-containing protein [Defluviitaleaceae bacterium]
MQRKKKKSRFAFFYIVMLVAGVAVCLVIFAMAFQTLSLNNPPIIGRPSATPTTSPLPGSEPKDIQRATGMISYLNPAKDPREITFIMIESGRVSQFAAPDGTEIKNRYGTVLSFSELAIGKIFDVSYDQKTMQISSMMENTQTWEHRNRTNVKVSLEDSTITVGNETYGFSSSQTLVLYRDQPYPIGQISTIDTVSLIGHRDKVWWVRLESSHGFLWIDNASKVEEGRLSINTSIYRPLGEVTEPIALVEGTHRVLVEGANIETYMEDVVIRPNETVTINLIEVEIKKAVLRVFTNEPEFTLIIDGVEHPSQTPAELTYGEHTIRVEKEGYLPIEDRVELTQAYTEKTFNMQLIEKRGRLIVQSEPYNGEVFLNGVFVGYTTYTGDMDLGPCTIVVKKEGYEDSVYYMNIVEGDNHLSLWLNEAVDDPFANLPSYEGTIPDDGFPYTEDDPIYVP